MLFSNFLSNIPSYVISLPVVLLTLSFHEMSHAWAAYKLGDPTARNLGRLTLNPLKHLDPIGFLCMVLLHFGWANPVPINSRNFKNPRRDMALSSLAGPASNVLLAIISVVVLRLLLWAYSAACGNDLFTIAAGLHFGDGYQISILGTVLAILVYLCYLGVIINLSFAIFNFIPIPPLDGSRILYVFLPPKWYFGVMRYERIIMLGMLVLLWTGALTKPLNLAVTGLRNLLFLMTGMGTSSDAFFDLSLIITHINSLL